MPGTLCNYDNKYGKLAKCEICITNIDYKNGKTTGLKNQIFLKGLERILILPPTETNPKTHLILILYFSFETNFDHEVLLRPIPGLDLPSLDFQYQYKE